MPNLCLPVGCVAAVWAMPLALPGPLPGQQRCPQGVEPARIAVIAAGFAAGEVVVLAARHRDWWTTPDTSFHFTSGGSAAKGQDLLLHGALAYQTSQVGALLFDWACVRPALAGWLGAALGIAVSLPKEIGDGLHAGKGFAVDDMGAAIAGALLPALHRAVPATRAISWKVFYWPSAEYRDRVGALPTLENDYAGQRHYLAFQPGALAGGGGPWPDWLGVAVGHGVPAWASVPPTHDWYVALDLRLRGLPLRGAVWRRVATVLDQLHLPGPGLRVRHGKAELGLVF